MISRVFSIVLLTALAACGGAAPPTASTPAPRSANVAISASGGTVNFPDVAGYGGTFVYSSNDASSAAAATVVTIDKPGVSLIPGQAPPGTVLAGFEFMLNQSVTFTNWYRLLTTITIPSATAANGRTFSEYGYDVTAGVAEGYNPGTVSGTTISFGAGFGPVTLLANHTYLIILTAQ